MFYLSYYTSYCSNQIPSLKTRFMYVTGFQGLIQLCLFLFDLFFFGVLRLGTPSRVDICALQVFLIVSISLALLSLKKHILTFMHVVTLSNGHVCESVIHLCDSSKSAFVKCRHCKQLHMRQCTYSAHLSSVTVAHMQKYTMHAYLTIA